MRYYEWGNDVLLPTQDAKNWYCKYKLSVDPNLIAQKFKNGTE
jgi:hypothetical protein